MKNSTNILITILITAGLGILAGLLIAPESGRRTRKKLLKSARRFNDSLHELAYNSGETYKDVKESLIDFTDAAGHKFEMLLKKR